jgi:molybdate transport system substrate-binding protein
MRTVAVALALALVLVAGCGDDDRASNATTDEPLPTGSITVSGAASLTKAFTRITDDFIEADPGTDIAINFGSSGQLSTQIREGAPADVAAFADEASMVELEDAGLLADAPRIFARNQLIIVTKPGNPNHIENLDGLATAGVISLCAETAPCGKLADQVLTAAGVTIPSTNVTRGQDVTTTLAAVTEGDAEAAIVYVTDAASAGDRVGTVEIPEADNIVAAYPIAVIAASRNIELARAFEAHVLGDAGQAVLREAGFLAP